MLNSSNLALPRPTKPEWLRVAEAVRTFGISRSKLYDWMKENKIKSSVIKKRGALRGIRLINYDSLVELIELHATQQAFAFLQELHEMKHHPKKSQSTVINDEMIRHSAAVLNSPAFEIGASAYEYYQALKNKNVEKVDTNRDRFLGFFTESLKSAFENGDLKPFDALGNCLRNLIEDDKKMSKGMHNTVSYQILLANSDGRRKWFFKGSPYIEFTEDQKKEIIQKAQVSAYQAHLAQFQQGLSSLVNRLVKATLHFDEVEELRSGKYVFNDNWKTVTEFKATLQGTDDDRCEKTLRNIAKKLQRSFKKAVPGPKSKSRGARAC